MRLKQQTHRVHEIRYLRLHYLLLFSGLKIIFFINNLNSHDFFLLQNVVFQMKHA